MTDEKTTDGASLLPVDPSASPGAELAAGGNDTGPSPTETASCIMDYPTAWAFIREQHPDPNEHDPRCSWVQASGGILCDCHVLNDEYARRKAARSL